MRLVWGLSLLVWLALGGCGRNLPLPGAGGELVVGMRNSPTTYYTDQQGEPAGFEYDLVARFAQTQGWRLRVVLLDDLDELLTTVREGRVHLAAAGLTATPARKRELAFGPAYGEVKEWVVCNAKGPIPRDISGLAGLRLEVVAGSSHAESLRRRADRQPGLQWVEVKTAGSEELMERVDMGLTDCAVSDSDSLEVAHNFHTNLQDAFVLQEGQPQAWALRQGADVVLARKLSTFFQHMHKSGELENLRERYFGHVNRLADADVAGILERRSTLLRALEHSFHEAQQLTGLDWRLLAAVAYQESQWDNHAVSPTGVRGLMMLTEATANHLGVKDRLDARESILGGARYITQLRDGLPREVPEPDRIWLAMAAYNLGLGHVRDARELARRLGKNPNSWRDMKDVLPLLARPRHHAGLRYGYARGGEARAFAENVRIYYDILTRYEKPYRDIWPLGQSQEPARKSFILRLAQSFGVP
ncbi:MAG TPA: membrane-bound lytic murein transglycosylase MltF [Thiobacillaceae bacterium]|nr:membrane-bound lytic murein transglycosylase MltF [Thiobacillaceae bacterium]HNU63006.1 membrane-bound lytic murein transglycosylase MltF [Thiobacillaceae bacterium]